MGWKIKRERMSSKERVKTALAFKEPDRVPIQIYMTPEIEEQLKEYFKGRDILEALEIDFRSITVPWRGAIKESHNDVTYNIWGVGFKKVKTGFGTYDEPWERPLAKIRTWDDFNRYPWPDINNYDFSTVKEQCEKYSDYAVCFGEGVK